MTDTGLEQEDAADALCGVAYGLVHTEHYDEGVKRFKQACAKPSPPWLHRSLKPIPYGRP